MNRRIGESAREIDPELNVLAVSPFRCLTLSPIRAGALQWAPLPVTLHGEHDLIALRVGAHGEMGWFLGGVFRRTQH
jgi:hypothetical protein